MYSIVWLEPIQSEKNLSIMPLVTSNAHIQFFSGMSGSTIITLQSARESRGRTLFQLRFKESTRKIRRSYQGGKSHSETKEPIAD
jgi:hypothetical protein